MRSHECARGAAIGTAPVEQHVSGEIEHEDAAREVVGPAPASEVHRTSRPPERGDVDQALPVDVDVSWPLDVVPDLEQLAGQAEDLDAVILTVGDEHAVVGDPDAMRDVELTGAAAELAPGLDEIPADEKRWIRAFP